MQTMDARAAMALLSTGAARLIDVREPAEFAARHAKGAQSLPLSRLDHGTLAPQPGETLIVMCASGRRSAMGCERIAAAGVEAFSLDGGLAGWEAAGGAIIKGARNTLPIERQVLLIAGLLVLTGVLLAQSVNPAFIWLSAVMGAGLAFAGLTGFCGMALLLARAPWNQRGA